MLLYTLVNNVKRQLLQSVIPLEGSTANKKNKKKIWEKAFTSKYGANKFTRIN